jgi:hypothetical protein
MAIVGSTDADGKFHFKRVAPGDYDLSAERNGFLNASLIAQDQQAPAQAPSRPPYMEQTAEQLEQLAAPIALYPDSLVAQILAASTFPEQVVDADRWVQAHPDLKGEALAQAVDQLLWDPSVKALTAFPSVLGNMDKNLSWTSSLGDAYYGRSGAADALSPAHYSFRRRRGE